jgi:hypothetical protein
MKLVDTYEELPDPKEYNGYCGVDRPSHIGRLITHHRGIYLTVGGGPWSFVGGEGSNIWKNEEEVWKWERVKFRWCEIRMVLTRHCQQQRADHFARCECPVCQVEDRLYEMMKEHHK